MKQPHYPEEYHDINGEKAMMCVCGDANPFHRTGLCNDIDPNNDDRVCDLPAGHCGEHRRTKDTGDGGLGNVWWPQIGAEI